MTTFPHPIPAGNAGDGSPLVLGDENVIGDLFAGGSAVKVLDWDADGEPEVVVTGGNGDIYSYKFIGEIADGTPSSTAASGGAWCHGPSTETKGTRASSAPLS